jgi:molybdate transport repressor ModE-like protein
MTVAPTAPRRTPLGALELLVAIDTHGSITAAARALDVAQPSVSAGLRRLERRTGLSLVARSTGGTVLTDLGRRVVVRARDVLAASDAFEGEVAALSAEQGGRLTVAASMTIAEYLVPRWLADRPVGAAVVDLTVANSRDVMEAVLHGRADLGFIEGPDLADGLRARSVGHDELLVVAAPGHPWADLDHAVGAAELATAPLVLRETGSGTRATLERALEAAGHPLATAPAQLGSTAAVKSVTQGGRAVAVVSALAVQGELALGTLRRVRIEGIDLRRDLRMVWAIGRQPTPPARELAALVVRLTSDTRSGASDQRKPFTPAQATA